jgi:2-polyprenyl-3-methyl-5-hydroxy-6-metoxy-1,4-benzoquinol methylase
MSTLSVPAVAAIPGYDRYRNMADTRAPLAQRFARQILLTSQPFLSAAPGELDVLDVGCGYGHTALELARSCRSVVGIEPTPNMHECAVRLREESGMANLEFRNTSIYELADIGKYDLVVLDNVFEHLPDQPGALKKLCACLKPGGAVFLLMPNKLWPIEVHYGLPFLSYLPLRLANWYLRLTGRGTDYTDASYAPTFFRLRRLLRAVPELSFQFVLPADPSGTMGGTALHYRLGMAAIRRFPLLWTISKAFLVVAVKDKKAV